MWIFFSMNLEYVLFCTIRGTLFKKYYTFFFGGIGTLFLVKKYLNLYLKKIYVPLIFEQVVKLIN